MSTKRNTKIALASLLAVSAISPVVASADTPATTTTTTTQAAAKTIDFTVQEASGMLARFLTSPAALVERNGQQYMQLDLSASVLSMLKAVTVNGATALYEFGGNKMVLVPVTAEYAPVDVQFTIESPFATGDYKATLTPNKDSIKEKVEQPTAPTTTTTADTAAVFQVGKTFGQVQDGTYDVTFDAYNSTTKVGNYTSITNHFNKAAKLIVKDGKYALQVEIKDTSKSMISGLKVAGKDAKVVENAEGKLIYVADIASISDLHSASVHVVVAAANMDKWYDFGLAIDTKALTLPEVAAPAQEVSLYAYKDGEKVLSIVQGKYIEDKVLVTATEGGFDVDITFPEGQYIKGFKVEGTTVAEKSTTADGANVVKVYTVKVKDLTSIYTATLDLSVRAPGVSYDSVYNVQLQFGGKQNPFNDILKSANYGAIVSLYSQGIFKQADTFNPGNNVKRSQFALMLNRALKLEVPATTTFKDIATYDKEAQDAIKALNNYGVINGTSATTFAPNNEITRKQAALMIYRLLVKNGLATDAVATAKFTDLPADVEAQKAISTLNALGIMTGFEGKFNPENKLTRNQMAKVLNNTLTTLDGLK